MAIPPVMPLQPVSKPKPPGITQQANAPKFAKDKFDAKEKDFMDATVKAHSEDTKISLLSEYGYFKVFNFDLAKKNTVKQKTVFFVNHMSETVVATWGHICINWLSILPDRSKIIDFPIANERPQKKNKTDRISRFSNYTLRWDHGTFKVTKEPYQEFNPEKGDQLILFNEVYDLGIKNVNFKNWKEVIAEKSFTQYKEQSRTFRETGTPTQILLHETAGKFNQTFTGWNHDKKKTKLFFIPHFCINNIDRDTQTGNIIQVVDVAERVMHGELMNARSVGIEFVNTPIEEYEAKEDGKTPDTTKPRHKLTEAKNGIYIKSVVSGTFGKLFIPLEFSADNKSKNFFELNIPSAKLLNKGMLLTVKVDKVNIATEKDKVVTIKYCKSEKFEHLASLVKTLSQKDVIDIDLADFDTWKCNVKEKDKELFVFNKAYQPVSDKTGDVYWLDIRKKGIYSHGFAGHHSDGHMQALYCFLKFCRKLDKHEDALKKMIDVLIKGTVTKIKRKAVIGYKEEKIYEFKEDKDLETGDCIEIPK